MIKENYLYNIVFLGFIYGVIYFGGLILLKDKNIILILKNKIMKGEL